MSFIVGLLLYAITAAVLFYPLIRLLDCMLFGTRGEDRTKEYKILASQILLTYEQMREEIQGTRRQMGMDPLPITSIAEKFNNRFWGSLLLKIKKRVRNSLDEIFWRKADER